VTATLTQMPATAFVFPGLNGADRANTADSAETVAVRQLPGFGARWQVVVEACANQRGFPAFDVALRRGHELPRSPASWPWRALAVAAMQLATVDELERRGERATWLCGYSIGDLARSCHAGASTWAQIVAFAGALPAMPAVAGKTVAVVTATATLGTDLLASLRNLGVDACRLSPRFLLLAGASATLRRARPALVGRGIRVRDLGPCPLHSALLQPLAALLAEHARRSPFATPRQAIFSTVWGRATTPADDLRTELTANVAAPIDFAHAVQALHTQHGVVRFVDLGPGRHAQRFVTHHQLPVAAVHAHDVLGMPA